MAPEKNKEYVLLSDEPLLVSDRSDNLEFSATANVLAKAALYTPDPITIGVYGEWGSGKTSMMQLMKDIIDNEDKENNHAVTVWFNAWQYEREEHLIIPLIATIGREIKNKEAEWDNTYKEGGNRIYKALRAVLYGVSMKGKIGLPGTAEIEISASMKEMIERYEEVTQDTLIGPQSILRCIR